MVVLAPILPLGQPLIRVRTLPWRFAQTSEFRRQHYTAAEAALKYRMSATTVSKWVHQGKLSAVRVPQGALFIDKRELAAFVKTLPGPGTKTRAKVLKHRRTMARRRLRRRVYS